MPVTAHPAPRHPGARGLVGGATLAPCTLRRESRISTYLRVRVGGGSCDMQQCDVKYSLSRRRPPDGAVFHHKPPIRQPLHCSLRQWHDDRLRMGKQLSSFCGLLDELHISDVRAKNKRCERHLRIRNRWILSALAKHQFTCGLFLLLGGVLLFVYLWRWRPACAAAKLLRIIGASQRCAPASSATTQAS